MAHLADVQEAIDAADIHEGAVVHHAGDRAAPHLSLSQLGEHLLPRRFFLALDDVAAADDQIFLVAIELRHLGRHPLADKGRDVFLKNDIDLSSRHERSHALHLQLQAAFVHAGDSSFDNLADFQIVPGDIRGQCAAAGEDEQPLARVIALDVEFHVLADVGDGFELRQRGDPLALAAQIDKNVIFANGDDSPAAQAFGGQLLARFLLLFARLVEAVELVELDAAQRRVELAVQGRVGIGTEFFLVLIFLRGHGAVLWF